MKTLDQLILEHENLKGDKRQELSVKHIEESMPEGCERMTLFVISDARIGSSQSELGVLKRHVERISKIPNARIIINGGMFEEVKTSAKYYSNNPKRIAPVWGYDEQCRFLEVLLEPVKDKILVWALSDQELKLFNSPSSKQTFKNFIDDMGCADRLAQQAYSLDVTLSGKKKQHVVIAGVHGFGNIKTRASAIRKLEKFMEDHSAADFYVMSKYGRIGTFSSQVEMHNPKTGKNKIYEKDVHCLLVNGYMLNNELNRDAGSPHVLDHYVYEIFTRKSLGRVTSHDTIKEPNQIVFNQIDIDDQKLDNLVEGPLLQKSEVDLHNERIIRAVEEKNKSNINYQHEKALEQLRELNASNRDILLNGLKNGFINDSSEDLDIEEPEKGGIEQ